MANMVAFQIDDPGNAGAIPVGNDGSCLLVSAAAETRTLAAPSYLGQLLSLVFKTDGGTITIACATGVNQSAHTSLVFEDAGDHLLLMAAQSGSDLRWRVVCNDGVTVS